VLIGRGVIKKEEWDSKKPTVSEAEELNEDLRNWFKPDHPEGGWKRINSKGEAIGPCAREPGEPKPKCMSNEKRASLTKGERAAAVAAKRRHDPNPERKGAPINVSNFGKGKISESVEYIEEKNAPTNPSLWARAKALAKQKFDVYPSAYANGWAAKWYKSKGGGWKTVSEEVELDEMDNQIHHPGTKVKVPHRGKMVSGKVVRHDKGDKYGSPFYVVDVGEYESAKVPAHNVTKEEVELTEGNDDVGEMIKDKLKIIINRAQEMHDGIKPNTDMPEWVKSKITLAQDYVSTACDYSCGKEQLGENVELDERCWDEYKPVKGKDAYSKGSCKKEETELAEASSTSATSMHAATRKRDPQRQDPEHNFRVGDDVVAKKGDKPGKVVFVDGEKIHVKGTNPYYPDRVTHHTASELKKDAAEGYVALRTKSEELELNEGRPSQRHPLEGHDYHKKSHVELRAIMKDAGEAKQKAREMGNEEGENKYADQVNDAATVLHWRKQNGTPEWYQKKYGHMKNEEVEIQEDMGEPDIKVRSTYTKAYADHYKRALRMNPKGASTKARLMAYDTVKSKHGEDAADVLRAFHYKNQNEEYQLDEELSSKAKMVKELFNKAKEKKSKKDSFEADPEMEIMPSPQYAQPKK